ncbi:hypothetical protein BIFGAL_02527 [Bifidobacterium gallicum DSM 20093 = LMG 11596]|uniref:Uncharacterized protein n=1 Tax=Bifidobacterium gallicum DSM 20093 = LMG 11596 TaxID=561180 RepID=D1NRX5_9BIFI|nr:hypothetical protein BIFGAL_02527 [Bifidobacterium gallicum DSM 20093 = LMG 11596]
MVLPLLGCQAVMRVRARHIDDWLASMWRARTLGSSLVLTVASL